MSLPTDNHNADTKNYASMVNVAHDVDRNTEGKVTKVTNIRLQDSYRKYSKYGDTDEEKAFKWFVENILAVMSPKETDFQGKKSKKRISEIFSPADEAWALMVLLNEKDQWDWEHSGKRGPKPGKYFTSSSTGKSWSQDDIDKLKLIQKWVNGRREVQSMIEWEERYKDDFKNQQDEHQMNAGVGSSNGSGEDDEVDEEENDSFRIFMQTNFDIETAKV